MDPTLEIAAKVRARRLGFTTFSAYVDHLIRADLRSNGPLILVPDKEIT